MKTVIICPFDVRRLTGTPIRTISTIKAVSEFSEVLVITNSNSYSDTDFKVFSTGDANAFSFSYKTLKELIRYKPNTIHGVTTLSILPAVIYKYLFNLRAKLVFEMHGWAWFESKDQISKYKRVLLWMLDVIGFIFSNNLIVMSFKQKSFLEKKFYNKKNISVVWGPAEFANINTNVEDRAVLKVGYLGNSSFWQGLDFVIEAAKLMEGNAGISFELAGFHHADEKRFPKLRNVSYVGFLDRDRVPGFIQRMDVMLSTRVVGPVSDLQYPQKLSEYLAAGRPVIASNTNDQKDIIESNRCGYILDKNSPEEIVSLITKMKELEVDDRESMCRRAFEFAKNNFSFNVFMNKIKLVYDAS